MEYEKLKHFLSRKVKIESTLLFFEAPEIKSMFDAIESDICNKIKKTSSDNEAMKISLSNELRAVDMVRNQLNAMNNELNQINNQLKKEGKL